MVDKAGACVLAGIIYCGGMRQSILLKSLVIIAGVAAVGVAAFLGFRHTSEVQGKGDIALMAADASAAASTLAEADRFLDDLRAGDYTTYTHPVYGFSIIYPKAFELVRTITADKDRSVFRHPRLPLALEITVYPIPRHPELVSWLAGLPADYYVEAPAGADSTAVGWIDEDHPSPGQYTANVWFAHQDSLYEVLLMAPDPELLQAWKPQVVNTDLTLSAQ
jgi:hypothetical protein